MRIEPAKIIEFTTTIDTQVLICYQSFMKEGLNLHIRLTKNIPKPTYYAAAIDGEFANYSFNEERAHAFRGKWREDVFKVNESVPFDLEIGTGNGFYFAHHAISYPERCLLGIEIKYKPLIQSIRRALRQGCENARIARYNANYIWELFKDNELDNVYIHFPDPWVKRSKKKNRLINAKFLLEMHKKQKENSFIEFKTDSLDYFIWAHEFFKASEYVIEDLTYDLHSSKFASTNFVTHFEKIFIKQDIKINYLKAYKR